MIGTDQRLQHHSVIFGWKIFISWLNTLCSCTILGKLVFEFVEKLLFWPTDHSNPMTKKSKILIFQCWPDVSESSQMALVVVSWVCIGPFWCLVGPGVVEKMSGRSFLWGHFHSASQKPKIFKFLDFLSQTCLERPLMDFVDWKVVCNASFGCLGAPDIGQCWYERTL